MVKSTCHVAPQRKIETPRKLGLGSPQRKAPAQHYLTWSKHNQSIKCNKHVLDECIKWKRKWFFELWHKITKIGVAVAKIWRKEFWGPICNFWKVARGISGIILKNQGSSWKFGDCGLIIKKPRGLFANFLR
jgi:hypothetical protein